MYFILTRKKDNGEQTIGTLDVKDSKGNVLLSLATLEQEWASNQRGISCVPCGYYVVKKRYSLRHGWHLHLVNVANRDFILIHSGNFAFQSSGCILVGTSFKDINGDGQMDVLNSNRAMKSLMALADIDNVLKVHNADGIWLL